jgi:hypothetical protein
MTRHAIIDSEGNVRNVVIWEGKEWLPPRNHLVVASEICDIGDVYNDDEKTFLKKDGSKHHKDKSQADYKAGL